MGFCLSLNALIESYLGLPIQALYGRETMIVYIVQGRQEGLIKVVFQGTP